jgi:hypothetical protein
VVEGVVSGCFVDAGASLTEAFDGGALVAGSEGGAVGC